MLIKIKYLYFFVYTVSTYFTWPLISEINNYKQKLSSHFLIKVIYEYYCFNNKDKASGKYCENPIFPLNPRLAPFPYLLLFFYFVGRCAVL